RRWAWPARSSWGWRGSRRCGAGGPDRPRGWGPGGHRTAECDGVGRCGGATRRADTGWEDGGVTCRAVDVDLPLARGVDPLTVPLHEPSRNARRAGSAASRRDAGPNTPADLLGLA